MGCGLAAGSRPNLFSADSGGPRRADRSSATTAPVLHYSVAAQAERRRARPVTEPVLVRLIHSHASR